MDWLGLEDANTSFFSQMTKQRQDQNFLLKLLNTDGSHLKSKADIENGVVESYPNLFAARPRNIPGSPLVLDSHHPREEFLACSVAAGGGS